MSMVSLYDFSGAMCLPWAEAGHTCYAVDMQHPPGHTQHGLHPNIVAVGCDMLAGEPDVPRDTAFNAAFPPCDNLAVSGACWMKGKGLRSLAHAIELVAAAADWCADSPAPYMIENPVSTLATYWRKPDYTFHPYDYTLFELGDNYTKKTCLWTGNGFVMPDQRRAPGLAEPDDRIHKARPGPERKNFRSRTPLGFARAVFETNKQTIQERQYA